MSTDKTKNINTFDICIILKCSHSFIPLDFKKKLMYDVLKIKCPLERKSECVFGT